MEALTAALGPPLPAIPTGGAAAAGIGGIATLWGAALLHDDARAQQHAADAAALLRYSNLPSRVLEDAGLARQLRRCVPAPNRGG